MKIIKHCSQTYPTTATGSLVGLDANGILQITNTFPFPTIDASTADAREDSIQNLAAAAPRAKANTVYQNEMIRYLREVNVDANNVGWYTSTSMGNFINANTIENQFFYQKELTERTVALVYDTSRSVQGTLSLRAFRLSSLFMTAFKDGKFTTDRYVERISKYFGSSVLMDKQPPKKRSPLPRHPPRTPRHNPQLPPPHLLPAQPADRTSNETPHLSTNPRLPLPPLQRHSPSSTSTEPRLPRPQYRPLP